VSRNFEECLGAVLGAIGAALGEEGDKLDMRGREEEEQHLPPSFEEANPFVSGSPRSTTPASALEEDPDSKSQHPSPPSQPLEPTLVPLAAASRLLPSDLSFSRFAPEDLVPLQAASRRLVGRCTGMQGFWRLIEHGATGLTGGDDEVVTPKTPKTPVISWVGSRAPSVTPSVGLRNAPVGSGAADEGDARVHSRGLISHADAQLEVGLEDENQRGRERKRNRHPEVDEISGRPTSTSAEHSPLSSGVDFGFSSLSPRSAGDTGGGSGGGHATDPAIEEIEMETTLAGDRTCIRSSTPLQVPPGHVRIKTHHSRAPSIFEKWIGGHSHTNSVSCFLFSGCGVVISSRLFCIFVSSVLHHVQFQRCEEVLIRSCCGLYFVLFRPFFSR
jgi:hypothetical protein